MRYHVTPTHRIDRTLPVSTLHTHLRFHYITLPHCYTTLKTPLRSTSSIDFVTGQSVICWCYIPVTFVPFRSMGGILMTVLIPTRLRPLRITLPTDYCSPPPHVTLPTLTIPPHPTPMIHLPISNLLSFIIVSHCQYSVLLVLQFVVTYIPLIDEFIYGGG